MDNLGGRINIKSNIMQIACGTLKTNVMNFETQITIHLEVEN